jgi:hypothetical protein
MKPLRCSVLCATLVFAAVCAAAEPMPAQTGSMATVRLLGSKRLTPEEANGAPDGLQLVFFVQRNEGSTGPLTLRETKDAMIQGRSYREQTRAELGRGFEPSTIVNNAADYFETNPAYWLGGDVVLAGAYVVATSLFGAALEVGESVEFVMKVGFGGKAESFSFALKVP